MKMNGGFQSSQGARSTAEKGQVRTAWGSHDQKHTAGEEPVST